MNQRHPEQKTPHFCPDCGKKYPDEVTIRSEIVSDEFPHVWVCYHCGHRWIDLKIAEWNAAHGNHGSLTSDNDIKERFRKEIAKWKDEDPLFMAYVHGQEAERKGTQETVIKALQDAIDWGEKYGDDMIKGFLKARITHIKQDIKDLVKKPEPKWAKRGTASRIIPRGK